MDTQESLYQEAKHLASQGEEFAHLLKWLPPNECLRLKHHILNLDEEIALKTIYGKVAWSERVNVPKGRGRPRKN